MTVTKRTLERWRKEALELEESMPVPMVDKEGEMIYHLIDTIKELNKRMIRVTQELLDQHLMRGR